MTVVHAVLGLAPVLLLACSLLAGRYPGERALAALRPRTRPQRHTRHAAAPDSRPRSARPLPRGGCLVSSAIASRPPPPVNA